MANLSSNTLFHFTKWDNLIGILENEFTPRYCVEKIIIKGNDISEFAMPMICFCDIPLSQIRLHVKRYGCYGIGLKKEWGINNGINPVLYLEKNSFLSYEIFQLLIDLLRRANQDLKNEIAIRERLKENLIKLRETPDTLSDKKELLKFIEEKEKEIELLESMSKESDKMSNVMFDIMKYLKAYEGYSLRNQEMESELIRFYDEREWRYVPDLKEHEKDLKVLDISNSLIDNTQFDNKELFKKANTILDRIKLSFTPDDINYIIVKEENEILEMIRKLEQIKGDKYPANKIKILTSRILTYDQIKDDF